MHVPYDVTCHVLGVVTEDDRHFDQQQLISLTPGSPAERHLANKNALGYYILSMNGVRIRSVSDIRLILHDYHDPDGNRSPAYLSGITMLFGVAQPNSPEPDHLEFSEQDHATACVVWSVLASSFVENETDPNATFTNMTLTDDTLNHTGYATGGGHDPQVAQLEMQAALLSPSEDDVN